MSWQAASRLAWGVSKEKRRKEHYEEHHGPDGDDGCVQTSAGTRDDTADEKHGQSIRCRLQDGADDHQDGAGDDGSFPAKLLAEEEAGQTA